MKLAALTFLAGAGVVAGAAVWFAYKIGHLDEVLLP